MMILKLSWDLVALALITGVVLSLIYLALLWQTIKILPQIKKKGLFLFASTILRLAIFSMVAIFLVSHHPGQLIWMFIAFVITRLTVVGLCKNTSLKEKHG